MLRSVVGWVGSVDVDGDSVPPTLGSRWLIGLFNISASCCSILVCWRRWVALSGSSPFNAWRRSAAAATMRSPSEMVGALQWAG